MTTTEHLTRSLSGELAILLRDLPSIADLHEAHPQRRVWLASKDELLARVSPNEPLFALPDSGVYDLDFMAGVGSAPGTVQTYGHCADFCETEPQQTSGLTVSEHGPDCESLGFACLRGRTLADQSL